MIKLKQFIPEIKINPVNRVFKAGDRFLYDVYWEIILQQPEDDEWFAYLIDTRNGSRYVNYYSVEDLNQYIRNGEFKIIKEIKINPVNRTFKVGDKFIRVVDGNEFEVTLKELDDDGWWVLKSVLLSNGLPSESWVTNDSLQSRVKSGEMIPIKKPLPEIKINPTKSLPKTGETWSFTHPHYFKGDYQVDGPNWNNEFYLVKDMNTTCWLTLDQVKKYVRSGYLKKAKSLPEIKIGPPSYQPKIGDIFDEYLNGEIYRSIQLLGEDEDGDWEARIMVGPNREEHGTTYWGKNDLIKDIESGLMKKANIKTTK